MTSFKLNPGDISSAALVSSVISIPKGNLPENFTSAKDKNALALAIGKQILEGKATFQARVNNNGVDVSKISNVA